MNLRFAITAAVTAAALAGGLAGAAAAAPAGNADNSCFYARDVNGFSAVDDSTLNIRVGVNDVYQLALFAPTPDLPFAQGIAVKSAPSDFICSPLDATVVVRGGGGQQEIPVDTIRKLTPVEVAALPAKVTP